MQRFGRIPTVPLESDKGSKAIKGEIMVNWDGLCLMGKNPITGEIVRLGDADSLLGIINYIPGTANIEIPESFEVEGDTDISLSERTGWDKNNELKFNCNSIDSKIYVKSEYKIYEDRNYTLSFAASCSKPTIMHIVFDDHSMYDIKIAKSPLNKYRLTINTSSFERSYYEGFYITFEQVDFNIGFSHFMFEYGATANPWTDRTEITSVKVNDLNVNGVLTIKGIDILTFINGCGDKGASAIAEDIASTHKYIISRTPDSNYNPLSFTGDPNTSTVIAKYSVKDLKYGTYSIMLRMKSSSIKESIYPLATVNVYESSNNNDTLISSTNIYPNYFEKENEYDELGFVTKFKGANSDDEDKKMIIEIVANGDGETNIQIDYIYFCLSYTSVLPIYTSHKI